MGKFYVSKSYKEGTGRIHLDRELLVTRAIVGVLCGHNHFNPHVVDCDL